MAGGEQPGRSSGEMALEVLGWDALEHPQTVTRFQVPDPRVWSFRMAPSGEKAQESTALMLSEHPQTGTRL